VERLLASAILRVMGEALVAAGGAIIVGVLVFFAARLDARDQGRGLLREAEVLDKLPKDTNAYRAMEKELELSIARYSKRQASRWENRVFVNVLVLGYSVVVLGGVLNYSNDYINFGRAEGLVPTASLLLMCLGLAPVFGMLIGMIIQIVQAVRRRTKSEA
jgi:hypothetical protein